jgi:SPP1 gp7 family putative phage head morphogenesis protein
MPAKPSELQAAVLQWQGRTRVIGDSAAAGMQSSYTVILDQLEPRLQALSSRIQERQASGEPFSPSWLFQQDRYREMIRQAEILQGQYAAFAQQNLTNQQMAAVQAAYLAGVQQMSLLGVTGGDPGSAYGFAGMNDAAITNLVGAMQAETPLGKLFSGLADEGVDELKQSLVSSLGLGLGIGPIVAGMRQALALPGYRAARIARTEILRATNEGLRDAFIKSGVVKKWRWSAALSARTCAACLQQHGKVFPLTTPMQRHVQCRCSMSPYLGDGTDAPWVDGDTWLRSQDDAVQDAILTRQGGAAFRAGAVNLPDFSYLRTNGTWGDSHQVRSWSSIAKSKGLPTNFTGAGAPGGTQGVAGAKVAKPALAVPAKPVYDSGNVSQSAYAGAIDNMQRLRQIMTDNVAAKGDLSLSPADRAAAAKAYSAASRQLNADMKKLSAASGIPAPTISAQVWGSNAAAIATKTSALPKPAPKPKRTPAEEDFDAVFPKGRKSIEPDDDDAEDAMVRLFGSKRDVAYDVESELTVGLGVDPRLAARLTRKGGFDDLEIPNTTVNPSKISLVPTQNFLVKSIVDKYAKAGAPGGTPWLVKIGNDYFIADGHHRLAAARLTGSTSLQVKVAEFDKTGKLITPHKDPTPIPAPKPAPARVPQLTPQQLWRPKMTAAEADTWASGSVSTRTWLHGTGSATAATSIAKTGFDLTRVANGRAYGNGVYMTNAGKTTASFSSGGESPTTLELRVAIRKPINADELFNSSAYDDAFAEAQDWWTAQSADLYAPGVTDAQRIARRAELNKDPRSDANAYGIDKALEAAGGDAILVQISAEEQWLIVPDRELVTVTGSGPVSDYQGKLT